MTEHASESERRQNARRVLLQIARCPSGDPLSPPDRRCDRVFGSQETTSPAEFRSPEPWRGDLVSAPLLFVSSNPSWSATDDCPRADASEEALRKYYGAFDTALYPDIATTSGPTQVAFWHAIHYHAAWLFERGPGEVVPGRDFCITEVVHCKSKNGIGVMQAGPACVALHFEALMQCAGATVVVVLGDKAAALLNVERKRLAVVRKLGQRLRLVLWLPHPGARQGGRRTFASYDREQLRVAQDALRNIRR